MKRSRPAAEERLEVWHVGEEKLEGLVFPGRDGVMERGPALKIHEVDPGLAFQERPEHLDVPLFRRDHQRGETGFVRRLDGGARVDEFAHDFPFLFQRGGDYSVRTAQNRRAQLGIGVKAMIDNVASARRDNRQRCRSPDGRTGDERRFLSSGQRQRQRCWGGDRSWELELRRGR